MNFLRPGTSREPRLGIAGSDPTSKVCERLRSCWWSSITPVDDGENASTQTAEEEQHSDSLVAADCPSAGCLGGSDRSEGRIIGAVWWRRQRDRRYRYASVVDDGGEFVSVGPMSPDIGARTRNHRERPPFVSHNKFRTTQARTASSAGRACRCVGQGEVTFMGVLDAVSRYPLKTCRPRTLARSLTLGHRLLSLPA